MQITNIDFNPKINSKPSNSPIDESKGIGYIFLLIRGIKGLKYRNWKWGW